MLIKYVNHVTVSRTHLKKKLYPYLSNFHNFLISFKKFDNSEFDFYKQRFKITTKIRSNIIYAVVVQLN